jgi:acyl carrier protein phosphodiesterase
MNYLAHTLLSGKDENIIIGNFIADMIRRDEMPELSSQYAQGLELHRAIDGFTDAHPSRKKINTVLRPHHRKYAPVVTDILMDYILGQVWDRYSAEPIQTFADIRYEVIISHLGYMPDRVRPIIAKMIDGNFLIRYTTLSGLEKTFEQIKKQARFESNFHLAVADLSLHYDIMMQEFTTFFPDLLEHTAEYRLR